LLIHIKNILLNSFRKDGLNVEEVGGRRESQRPKAHSPGHRPMVLCPIKFIRPVRAKALI